MYIKEEKREEHVEEEKKVQYTEEDKGARKVMYKVMSFCIKLSFNILFVTVLGGRRAL